MSVIYEAYSQVDNAIQAGALLVGIIMYSILLTGYVYNREHPVDSAEAHGLENRVDE